MIPPPPRSTPTDTRFPIPALFRSPRRRPHRSTLRHPRPGALFDGEDEQLHRRAAAVHLAVEQRERRTEADPRIRLRGFQNAAGVINPPCRAAMGRWQREALTEGP